MCNCGNKREQLSRQSVSLSNTPETDIPNKMWQDVEFEYTGRSSMTAVGSITGKMYRFHHPGNIQTIDYRDAAGMMAVPVLRKVRV